MEYFSIIYKILKAIEKSMDSEEFDRDSISPGISSYFQDAVGNHHGGISQKWLYFRCVCGPYCR